MKQGIKKDMVAGLIIQDKRLLLVHNTKHNTLRIEPPGGKKEENESWEESVIRELKEELDIVVRPTKLFGVYDTFSPEGNFSVHMYFCEIAEGKPRIIEPDKISNFKWYSFDELEDLKKFGYLVSNMCEALVELKPILID
jgi:8-oxo-dGTP diphosphatase